MNVAAPLSAEPTTRRSWVDWLYKLGPLLALLLVFGIFAALVPLGYMPENFLTLRNLETIARQTTIVGIASLGMTMIIISGGIDLSVGSIIALSTVFVAWTLNQLYAIPVAAIVPRALGWYGFSLVAVLALLAFPLIAALGGIVIGAVSGLVNGLVVTRLKVVPFIVTLGTMLVLRGAAKGLGHEQRVEAPMTWLNGLLAALGPDQRWMIVPPGVWLLIVLALVMGGVLRYTKLGRHTFAIGSNEQTARLCGVPVERVKLTIYTLAAALAGLSGLMQFSRLTVGDPSVAMGLELDVIAAVVIGGGSLSGGEGSILGSLVGALIMTVISSGCSQMGLPSWVQQIVTGGIIIVAVALDRLRHRRAS